MVTSSPVSHLSGLAKRLVMDGLLAEELASDAQEKALKSREPYVSYLVVNKILDSFSIASSACQEFGTPLFDLNAMDLDAAPVSLVDEKLIRQHHTLPLFKRGNRLFRCGFGPHQPAGAGRDQVPHRHQHGNHPG